MRGIALVITNDLGRQHFGQICTEPSQFTDRLSEFIPDGDCRVVMFKDPLGMAKSDIECCQMATGLLGALTASIQPYTDRDREALNTSYFSTLCGLLRDYSIITHGMDHSPLYGTRVTADIRNTMVFMHAPIQLNAEHKFPLFMMSDATEYGVYRKVLKIGKPGDAERFYLQIAARYGLKLPTIQPAPEYKPVTVTIDEYSI